LAIGVEGSHFLAVVVNSAGERRREPKNGCGNNSQEWHWHLCEIEGWDEQQQKEQEMGKKGN
jgi:hypothetical protein